MNDDIALKVLTIVLCFLPGCNSDYWLMFRYPIPSMMVVYIFILILVGLSRTRLFQKLYGKYFKGSYYLLVFFIRF